MYRIVISAFLMIFFTACSSTYTNKVYQNQEDESLMRLRTNLEFIASDELEGRDTGSKGARVAAKFIASRLKQYGIKPFGDDSTYFQNFELQSTKLDPNSELKYTGSDSVKNLILGQEFAPFKIGEPIENTDIVFVGYGVSDSLSNYNDYEGLDVKGKTVLCMPGLPTREDDPDFLKTTKRAQARSTGKADVAMQKGAAGAIVLLAERWNKNWSRLSRMVNRERINKIEPEEKEINAAWVDSGMVKNLLSMPNLTYKDLIDTLAAGTVENGTVLNGKMSWNIAINQKILNARNVVGLLEGSDPNLKNEFVSVGAHYDHVGIGRDGQIYNGADDNGSGTVAILESARQAALLQENKRPILFLFYTGEEKGLLGAEHFVENFEQIKDVIVNLNMDMVGREHQDTMYVVGSGKLSGEFFEIVERSNKETVNFVFDYTLDDEDHPERIYYRSDHWQFAKNGIPVVFLTDYHDEDYHKPTDDADKINYEKLRRAALITTKIALNVANLDHRLIVDNANISGKVIQKDESKKGAGRSDPLVTPPPPPPEKSATKSN